MQAYQMLTVIGQIKALLIRKRVFTRFLIRSCCYRFMNTNIPHLIHRCAILLDGLWNIQFPGASSAVSNDEVA